MITLTRLDGKTVCVNETNILWVEAFPDTCIMLLGGGRILVKQSVDEVKERIESLVRGRIAAAYKESNESPRAAVSHETHSIPKVQSHQNSEDLNT